MEKLTGWVTRYCVSHHIISEEQIPWFEYGLQKRISTVVVAVPFVLLAALLSDLWVALSFFACFYALRIHINGYHAKTLGGCFVISMLLVLVFLGIVYRLLTPVLCWILQGISVLLIFALAPYNHPKMHLNEAEIQACRHSARIRSLILLGLSLLAALLRLPRILEGITIGFAMAAVLLCLAYIFHSKKTTEVTL